MKPANQFDRPKRGKENGYRNMASLGLDIFDSKKFFKCLEAADFTLVRNCGTVINPAAKGWLKHVETQKDGMVYPLIISHSYVFHGPFIDDLPIQHDYFP